MKFSQHLSAFRAWLRANCNSGEVTASELAAHYAEMADRELLRIPPSELTALALPLWKAEIERRR